MTARTLYHSGTILPCDGVSPAAEALVCEAGRIIDLGDKASMQDLVSRADTHVDLGGATLLPGLVDTHPHAQHFAGMRIALVDLSDARDHDDIVARIAQRAATTPKGDWIFCTPIGEAHYFIRKSYRDLPERRLPDRFVLDKAASDHPVMIQAWAPSVPNAVAFNSMALKTLGLSWHTPKRVCNVWIDRNDAGELTGIVRGSVTNYYTHDPFWLQIWDRLPKPPEQIWKPGAQLGMAEMNQLGVTTIYESHLMDRVHIDAYRDLHGAGEMTCRVLTTLEAANQAFDPHYMPVAEDVIAALDEAAALTELEDPMLRHNGVTIARSGPCFPGFFRSHEPFKSPYGEMIEGYPFLPKSVEELVVDYCLKKDLRLNVLAGAPKDHEDFFHTVSCHHDHDIPERDWVVQHALLIDEDAARQYAELGMSLTTSKGFHWGKGDMYGERMGKHVWQDLIPLRRLLDQGLTVSAGTDWGPKNVFEQIALAVTCEFAGSGHRNMLPSQAITVEEALAMWTRDAAKVLQWSDVGTLATGNHADFAIVDRNPLGIPVDDIAATCVLRTMLGGNTVYDEGSLT